MRIHYEMFVEVSRDGSVRYDLVIFNGDDFGDEIAKAGDGPRTWEHVMTDIAIFQPEVIKINPVWKNS